MSRVVNLLSVCGVVLVVGCVPYSTYQQTKAELEKAKDANADLVRKYNQAMQKLMGQQNERAPDTSALQAELARLRQENDSLKSRKIVQPEFPPEVSKRLGLESEEGGLRLGEHLLFNEGSAKLKPEASKLLDEIVALLKSDYAGEVVIIEGHTDNQPLLRTKALWKYNIRLAYERAQAVFEYFIDHGIPESQMVVRAYSFNKPVDPATVNTTEGRAQNRRVVVRRGGTQI